MATVWFVTRHAEAVAEWIADNLPTRYGLGRKVSDRGRVLILHVQSDAEEAAIRAYEATLTVSVEDDPAAPEEVTLTFGGTMPRLSIYSRNAVSWLSARSWSKRSRKADMAALKAAKQSLDPQIIEDAADEMASVLRKQVGQGSPDTIVTHVACGHSKRPDCFACRLAQAVAERLGFTFAKLFADRPVSGVSHPKEFRKLPPLERAAEPDGNLVLLIDDVATSGWHMEEALTCLRDAGHTAIGAAWVSGVVE